MKTTLVIDDGLVNKLRSEAAKRGTTMSELVEAAIRLLLAQTTGAKRKPKLPTFNMGEARVDIDDRDKLLDSLDGL